MTFHFQCPYGHLLAGEESQAGQQCMCPVCTTLFIIPAPLTPSFPAVASPREPELAPAAEPSPSPFPEFDPYETKRSARMPELPAEPEATPEPPDTAPPVVATESETLHIPCPSGHMLEAPAEMLDQEVVCPHCRVKFRLRRQDSQEYKQKKRVERARKEERKGQAWIIWAVVVLVAVLLGLGYLILHSSGD